MKLKLRRTAILAWAMVLFAGALAPALAAPKNQMKVFFLNAGVQESAEGKLLLVQNKAQTFFMIKVSHMTPGTYDIMLNGTAVDTIAVNSDGSGRIVHRQRVNSKHADPSLPYDPRGGAVAIQEQASGTLLLEAAVPATSQEARAKIEIEIDLTNLGVIGGTAEAEFEARFGRMQFEVEVEGAAPGTYDLLVDGTKVGEILVDDSGHGEIEFDSRPLSDEDEDGPLDLLLTFDPRGKEIMLMDQTSAAAVFSVTFPLIS